ncbi:MAG TPA: efflux RND transporter periplasmic adaptor subunit, partial [Candidatus Agathobaculum merdavium]|nr:efflux RND transporter periplasmic adaptor subunit [Candidatus Agathobaculum merdavium]
EQGDILCALRPVTAAATAALTDSVQAAWDALSEGQAQSVQAEESSVLRAPMTGAVLSLPAEGEYVYTNVPCVRMADLENLQVRAQCPELYAAQLASGQQANVTVSALSDEVYGATLQSLAPVATRAVSLTGNSGEPTVEALLTLSGDTEGLRPGYSATVKVFTDRHTAAMAVPYEAVCQRGEQEYVFCVRDGHAVACPVETGYMLASSVEICSGIEPDDIVILSPADTLADGAPVEVTAWG